VAAVVVAAVVVGAAVLTSRGGGSGDAESPIPQAEPFTLAPVIAGQPAAVLPAIPGHPVVLAFFASWCAPCTEELPLIEKLSRATTGGPRGVASPTVVGVDELDQRPDGPDLVRAAGVTFPAGYDHDGSVGQKWHIDGLPITVFIAPDGRVVAYHRGQLSQHQLDGLVRRLTAASG
jgi:cytochrome c biogenesis protein CcmG/thiol:disulfide interchange protein DsbE